MEFTVFHVRLISPIYATEISFVYNIPMPCLKKCQGACYFASKQCHPCNHHTFMFVAIWPSLVHAVNNPWIGLAQ